MRGRSLRRTDFACACERRDQFAAAIANVAETRDNWDPTGAPEKIGTAIVGLDIFEGRMERATVVFNGNSIAFISRIGAADEPAERVSHHDLKRRFGEPVGPNDFEEQCFHLAFGRRIRHGVVIEHCPHRGRSGSTAAGKLLEDARSRFDGDEPAPASRMKSSLGDALPAHSREFEQGAFGR